MSTETLPGMGDAITAITFAWSLFYGSDLVLLPFRLFLEQKTRKTNGLETEIYRDFWLQNVSFRRCRWKLITENFSKNSQESDLTRISSSFSWIFLKMGPVPAFRWSFKWGVSLEKGENSDLGTPKQSSAYFASFSGKKTSDVWVEAASFRPPFFGGFYKSPPRITWEETSRCCSFILIEQLKKTNKVWFQVLVHAGRCMRRSCTRTTRNKGAQKIKFQFGCRNSLVKCFSQFVTAAPSISWL